MTLVQHPPVRRSLTAKPIVSVAIMLSLAIGVEGCAPGSKLAPLPPATDAGYVLGPSDQIRVITYNEPQLTNTFTVGDQGTIAFPLIGTVHAAGMAANEVASTISTSLVQKKLLSDPSVSVEITQYRPIFVLGEVSHPGQYPYQPGMTMLSGVALAGGFTYRAITGYAGAVRSQGEEAGHAIEGKVGRATYLQPGDVITIYERYF